MAHSSTHTLIRFAAALQALRFFFFFFFVVTPQSLVLFAHRCSALVRRVGVALLAAPAGAGALALGSVADLASHEDSLYAGGKQAGRARQTPNAPPCTYAHTPGGGGKKCLQ